MFCPNCSAYLTEMDLIKSNARYISSQSAPIEYDARCPACHEAIGRMSWGHLTVSPQLELKLAKTQEEDAPQEKNVAEEHPAPAPEQQPDREPAGKVCPHCGKPLPEDF